MSKEFKSVKSISEMFDMAGSSVYHIISEMETMPEYKDKVIPMPVRVELEGFLDYCRKRKEYFYRRKAVRT